MSRTAIRCNCGQRISQREVMQTGYYPRPFGPSLVFVRFRCSRCKKLGEQYVKQEEWENGILKENSVEANAAEKERFASLGPIEMNELVEFHHALNSLDDLTDLNAEFRKPDASDGSGERRIEDEQPK
jgi:phage FluMu protein Com